MGKGSQEAIRRLVSSNEFLPKINSIITPFALISDEDKWQPQKDIYNENQLKTFLESNFDSSASIPTDLHNWWAPYGGSAPVWDFISTCTINGEKGILIVEAKAHEEELEQECKGKDFDESSASNNSKANHKQIFKAIDDARSNINTLNSKFKIEISRDNCYQLSNRIAHAWWLANQGIPVVLVYLGILDCVDMEKEYVLFKTQADWEKCFLNHAAHVKVEKNFLDNEINCGKNNFHLICKSIKV